MEPTTACVKTDKFMEFDKEIRGNVTFTNNLKITIKGNVWFWINWNMEIINLLVISIIYTNGKKQHIELRTIIEGVWD